MYRRYNYLNLESKSFIRFSKLNYSFITLNLSVEHKVCMMVKSLHEYDHMNQYTPGVV